jgi:predicted nucleic acid-binding Zn ribbon protein
MAEPHVGPLPDGMKHCLVCAEPINRRALKCIHCQGDQSWLRQRMGYSSTVLSLLVALVSVMTASLPVIKETFTPKNSSLAFSPQGANQDYIALLASNQGVRPAVIRSAKLLINGERVVNLGVAGGVGHPAYIVAAGSNKLYDLYGTNFIAPKQPLWTKCLVVVSSTDFIGSSGDTLVPIACNELTEFISYHMPR